MFPQASPLHSPDLIPHATVPCPQERHFPEPRRHLVILGNRSVAKGEEHGKGSMREEVVEGQCLDRVGQVYSENSETDFTLYS